jgi:hypothetical protein
MYNTLVHVRIKSTMVPHEHLSGRLNVSFLIVGWRCVGPWLCKKAKIKEGRQSIKYMEGTKTEEGSKWIKKHKRRDEVKEN